MVPRELLEGDKGNRVALEIPGEGSPPLVDMTEKLWMEQAGQWLLRFKRAHPAEDFPTIIPGHPDRGYSARPFVYVNVGRTAQVHASVAQVNGALGVIGKPREEFLTHADHTVRLPAHVSQLTRAEHVLAIAKHSAEGIAGKRAGLWPPPGQDHPRVQASRERHSNALITGKITREVAGENSAQLPVKGFRVEW